MKTKEYETISAVVASRRKAGDDYGHIRADLEAARNKPFQDDEWGKIRFLAALDVAFASVPKPTSRPAPNKPTSRPAPNASSPCPAPNASSSNAVIHIHADTTGNWSVSTEEPK